MKASLPTVVFVTLAAAATAPLYGWGTSLLQQVQAQTPSGERECTPIARVDSVEGQVLHKRLT